MGSCTWAQTDVHRQDEGNHETRVQNQEGPQKWTMTKGC